jgi:hypothetical protein
MTKQQRGNKKLAKNQFVWVGDSLRMYQTKYNSKQSRIPDGQSLITTNPPMARCR